MLTTVLGACGGGGGNNPPPPPPPPAPTIGYTAPPAFTVNTAIAALTPTVTGAPTSYTVSPALPAGLSISATTGVISGTPTAAAAQTNYQVTASNAGGSGNATLAIRVNDVAPDVAYPRSWYTFSVGSPATVTPSSTAGTVVNWSINPALPAGLTINAVTGVINGTPTAVTASNAFTVTATNSGGTDIFPLAVAVADSVLLNLQSRNTDEITLSANRLVTTEKVSDIDATWTIWDSQNATVTAQYHSRYCIWVCGQHQSIAGNTLVSRGEDSFIVRSLVDGSLVSTIPSHTNDISWWRLSPDAGFIAEGDETGLRVWSRAGVALINKAGNYKAANPFLSNGVLRIANGPSGAQIIENYALPNAALTLSPAFNGTFRKWFVDGERFITTLSSAVYIYSKDAVQLDIAAPPSFDDIGGYGNFYWTVASYLRVYEVGNAAATVTTFTTTKAVLPYPAHISPRLSGSPAPLKFVDLRGAQPLEVTVTVPADADSMHGTPDGSLWAYVDPVYIAHNIPADGSPPKQFGLGRVDNIAGANDRAAIATADGKVRVYDLNNRSLLFTLTALNPKLAMTANGATLLVMPRTGTDRSLRFYSLPSGTLLAEWPYTNSNGQPYVTDFKVARSADKVALDIPTVGTNTRNYEVRRFDGTVDYSSTQINFLNLSADGTRSAVSTGDKTLTAATLIYTGATLSAASDGYSRGWLDSNRMLVSFYKRGGVIAPPVFDVMKIYDGGGNFIVNSGLKELDDFDVVSANSIYSRRDNAIFAVDTGTALWTAPAGEFNAVPSGFWQHGAVAGNYVVYSALDFPLVRVEPH